MCDTYKDWHEKLPYALLAYHTTIWTSTGATLFTLVYGIEVVIPIEVEIPFLQLMTKANLTEEEWGSQRLKHFNLADEKRLAATQHMQFY